MLNYVNLFTCASDKKDTFVLHLLQNEPIVLPDEEPKDIVNEVASVVMNKESLQALYDLVSDMLNNCDD